MAFNERMLGSFRRPRKDRVGKVVSGTGSVDTGPANRAFIESAGAATRLKSELEGGRELALQKVQNIGSAGVAGIGREGRLDVAKQQAFSGANIASIQQEGAAGRVGAQIGEQSRQFDIGRSDKIVFGGPTGQAGLAGKDISPPEATRMFEALESVKAAPEPERRKLFKQSSNLLGVLNQQFGGDDDPEAVNNKIQRLRDGVPGADPRVVSMALQELLVNVSNVKTF